MEKLIAGNLRDEGSVTWTVCPGVPGCVRVHV